MLLLFLHSFNVYYVNFSAIVSKRLSEVVHHNMIIYNYITVTNYLKFQSLAMAEMYLQPMCDREFFLIVLYDHTY